MKNCNIRRITLIMDCQTKFTEFSFHLYSYSIESALRKVNSFFSQKNAKLSRKSQKNTFSEPGILLEWVEWAREGQTPDFLLSLVTRRSFFVERETKTPSRTLFLRSCLFFRRSFRVDFFLEGGVVLSPERSFLTDDMSPIVISMIKLPKALF